MATKKSIENTPKRYSQFIEDKIVLLTGHRKSGTTMFHNLFDGHSGLSCYPIDLTVLYAYYPQFIKEGHTTEELHERLEKIVCLPLENLINKQMARNIDIEKFRKYFFSRINQENIKDPGNIIHSMISAWRNITNESTEQQIVVKETSSDIYAGEIFKWFPEMRVIHLVRDPRDNYASLKAGVEKYYSQMGENDLETLASILNRGLIDMKMALINTKRFGSDRYLVIRFEDLTRNTENIMKTVSSFLGIEYNASLLHPTIFGCSTHGNNYEGEKMSSVSTKNVGRWRDRITPEEAQIIEFYFSDVMEEFGYKNQFTPSQQADALSEFYKWSNYRYFYRDSFSNK